MGENDNLSAGFAKNPQKGPHMFFCEDGKDINTGMNGECEEFEGEADGQTD